jgi:hypothetical protein
MIEKLATSRWAGLVSELPDLNHTGTIGPSDREIRSESAAQ